MTQPWRILIVDDEQEDADLFARSIRSVARNRAGEDPEVTIVTKFLDAITRLSEKKFDLLILDIRDQAIATRHQEDAESDPGIGIFEEIRQLRFIPIIFHTAVPAEIQSHNNPPFVQVVSKSDSDSVDKLRDAVVQALQSDFPRIYRLLEEHSASVMREFMIEFVEKNWEALSDRRADMMHLLLRHLSTSLGRGAAGITAESGYGAGDASDDTVHPARYYAALPSTGYATGDVLRRPPSGVTNGDDEDTESWYVIVTPSCDLVASRRKAENVVLLQCRPLDTFSEYTEFVNTSPEGSDSKQKSARLRSLLDSRPYRQQADRYHYLPEAWKVPDLIVDNQLVISVPYDDLDAHYEKIASLDSPFAEELVHRFARYIGRLGTPDLNLDEIVERIASQDGPALRN